MSFRSFVFLSIFSALFFASCTSESVECITSLDCEGGLVCLDGSCVENAGKTDVDKISENDIDWGMPDNAVEPDNNEVEDKDVTGDIDETDVKDETGDTDDTDIQDETNDAVDTDLKDDEVQDEDVFITTPCNPNPCESVSMSNGNCTIQGENFKCECESGYYWNKGVCKDMNECLDSLLNDCDEFADCSNITGSYICACKEHYSGDGIAECVADTQSVACENSKPEHSVWNVANADGMISQTWNGTIWDPATDTCLWDCDEHYLKVGEVCDPEKVTFDCDKKPANGTEWNTVSSYERTWNGTDFAPAETAPEYNETPSETACIYKCAENYSWDGTECVSDIHIFKCYTKPFVGTQWNTVSSYEQTWDGAKWVPAASSTEHNETPSETTCRFICSENYSWNGSKCEAAKKTFNCVAKPETGTAWNTVLSYEQTWNGAGWFPADTTTEYNIVASATACRFICAEHYTWNGTECAADTKTHNCDTKPEVGTVWNNVSSYTQTWAGTAWAPAESTTVYNETSSDIECHYKCANNYTWDGSTCVADSRTFSCAAKPEIASEWNTVASYIQTWSGSQWLPEDSITEFNITASAQACRFQCIENYTWNGTNCVGATKTFDCDPKPATGTQWNTVASYTQTWSGTAWLPTDTTTEYNTTSDTVSCRYKCITNFTWNGSECEGVTQIDQACTGLPANASWNTASSIDQSWNGTAWVPSTVGAHNDTPSTSECRFKCDMHYTWNGTNCLADTQTFDCQAKPSTGTDWNTVASYTQTWNGSGWMPVDDSNTEYNTTASSEACRYKCSSGYTWNNTICEINSRTFTCASKPSTGTDWNTVSSYTQTWNGTAWTPADSTTSYNATSSSTVCRYKCADGYGWSGTECVEHECMTDDDCTDHNNPVCDTGVVPYVCVMCTENADCNSEVGEECDTNIKECWSGYTCQNSIWSLPNGGFYDWDDGNQDWTTTANYWGREDYRSRSGTHSWGYWDDYDYYGNNLNEISRISGSSDMSACSGCSVQASFYYMGDVESTSYDYDYIQAVCSGNGGSSWSNDSTLKVSDWTNWTNRAWTLPSGCLTSTFTFGMRFVSDENSVEDGMVIDDLGFSPVSTSPLGSFDGITSGADSFVHGWTCDGDDFSKELLVHLAFYKDENTGNTPVVKWIRAGTVRETAVGDMCGGDSKHGFYYPLEDHIKTALGSGTHAYTVEVAGSSGTCGGRFFSFASSPATFTLP